MAGEDEISEAGRKARFERWEQLGVDVIRTDLEATGGLRMVGGPPAVRRLAWEWVRMKEAQHTNLVDLVKSGTNLADMVAPASDNLADLVAAPSSRRPAPEPAPRPRQPPEVFTLKPGIWGMSIDLKELGRRGFNWWRGKK